MLKPSGVVMGPYWALLELSWAVLEACRAVLVALVAFLGRLGSLGEPQGGAMAAQGPPGVGGMRAVKRGPEGGGSLRRLQKPCQTALGILPRLNVPGGTVADLLTSTVRTWDKKFASQEVPHGSFY